MQAAMGNLAAVQTIKSDQTGAIRTMERMYQLNSGLVDVLKQIADLNRANGDFDEARDALERYAELSPEDYTGPTSLAEFSRAIGEHGQAREYLDRALLMEPGRPETLRSLGSLDLDVGRFDDARAGYDAALDAARTPQDRAAAWAALQSYHEFRGEMNAAIDAMRNWLQEASTFQPPYLLVEARFGDVGTYFDAGRGDEAVALFETLRTQLQPPMDMFIPLGDLGIALGLEDLDRAQAVGEAFEVVVTQNQMEAQRSTLFYASEESPN